MTAQHIELEQTLRTPYIVTRNFVERYTSGYPPEPALEFRNRGRFDERGKPRGVNPEDKTNKGWGYPTLLINRFILRF